MSEKRVRGGFDISLGEVRSFAASCGVEGLRSKEPPKPGLLGYGFQV